MFDVHSTHIAQIHMHAVVHIIEEASVYIYRLENYACKVS